ncbi:TonB-dependent receptor [Erythrobacter sp. SD-21]|uniref:TonB-dependent receptor n=1 Tax=Erythrobacter sp. SD-21 TaxID=161528 RepID=UPI000153F7B4|nr:TonB-dependent receptor [Erythrobacter sp. SD-21]EDL48429.1 TonB-dependent receptor [Erythrobacter sp. SD-21]
MKFKYLLATSVVGLSAVAASPAFAQSTGSIDFEDEGEEVIVVTGARFNGVGGVEIPDTTKAKQVLNEEIIRRQRPGQTVNDIVNLVPGVSFQNNDPWGSSGGGFTIRGFGADRVSQTLDGLPLNDSGNYALYTNQMVDPEVLEEVSVSLGSTDVDSPTASATGGTINIRTREPGDVLGMTATMTYGDVLAEGVEDSAYVRGFLMVDTGDITGMGTKAFGSVSYTTYGVPYNPYGRINKTQFNGRIWQDLGTNGDFVSISGHWNVNRNNFAGSEGLETLLSYYEPASGFNDKEQRFSVYEGAGEYPCAVDPRVLAEETGYAVGSPGDSVDYSDRNGCGAAFYRRFNPSDTGNIRGASRFSLTDALTLTVDPSYQYVKANGGGPDDLRESFFVTGYEDENDNFIETGRYTGAFNGGYYFGRDLNGDGDLDDEIAGNDPSQTTTDRYGVITNLIYEINPDHRVRATYTLDHARHRQTGQITYMLGNGEISDVFAIDNPLLDVNGNPVNKRDRLSYAILHQISGEYRGRFGDLTAKLALRAPFFTRELNQNCYTTSDNGFVDCPNPGFDTAGYELAKIENGQDFAPPQSRTYKYDKLLPNIGFTYDVTGDVSVFANYAKGLSVPGTDPLYDSLFLDANDPASQPVPETTDSFDVGLRFQSGSIQAQIGGYYTQYQDRLASAFDPDARDGEGARVFRNLGTVDKYGIDGSIAWRPTRNTLLYVFGSYNDSEIKDDVLSGTCNQFEVDNNFYSCNAVGDLQYLATGGKTESGTPQYSFGARGQIAFGPVELGAQAKRTGTRFVNDQNVPLEGELANGDEFFFPAKVPAYTVVDLDARILLGEFPTGGDVAVQLNLTNLFDEYYIGYFGGSLDDFGFAQIGAPRAGSVSLVIGF